MELIIIVLVLVLTLILVRKNTKSETTSTKGFNLKKLLLGIVLFIVLFYGYTILVGLISMIPLYFVETNTNTVGGDSGIWVYGLVAAIVLSPILSLITTLKILNREQKDKITRIWKRLE